MICTHELTFDLVDFSKNTSSNCSFLKKLGRIRSKLTKTWKRKGWHMFSPPRSQGRGEEGLDVAAREGEGRGCHEL